MTKEAVKERLPLTLCMEHGPGEGKNFVATHLKKITVGRTRTNSYPIKDPTISQKHAFIEWRVDHWIIVDIGSSNGTSVNGKALVENEPVRLQNGALVLFGELVKVRVQIEEEEEEEDDEDEDELEVEDEEEMEEEEGDEQGITVEEWIGQLNLRNRQTVSARAGAAILELKQDGEELKKRFLAWAEEIKEKKRLREHAGID